jgi:DUF971 family protein
MNTPDEVRIDRGANAIALSWPTGVVQSLSAAQLRRMCPCAECRRERLLRDSVEAIESIRIGDVQPMGYGIQIAFSDGHDRGIFPWVYLSQLATEAA